MNYLITESQLNLITESLDFDEVYNLTYPVVFREVCMKMSKGDIDQAKDFCQIGYMKVLRNLSQYSGTGNLTGWVRTVVKNEIFNEFRKKKLDVQSDFDFERADLADAPEEGEFLLSQVGKGNLKKAIESLPEGYKTILLLYHFSDMKHNDIAKLLGIDPGTSRSQLAKARIALKKAIGKYLNQNQFS
jgi:RNA polymerase sigma factor (sigma-70 family)